jgi:DNA-binding MarR family transcriptional regulator
MMREAGERDLGMAGWLAFQLYRVALARGLEARGYRDLREADWTLLRYLHHCGGATVGEIGHHYGTTKQAASQHVASFVARGYGIRTPSETDARIRVITLTDKGRAARLAAIDIADEIEADLDRRVGAPAVRAWRSVTDALVEANLADAPELVRVAAAMKSTRD